MKKIGSFLLCVGVIALFVLFLVQVKLPSNKPDNADNKNNIIALAEAKHLVDLAISACKGDDSGSLSPAAAENYEHDYVLPSDMGGNVAWQFLYLAKFALADSEASNGAFTSKSETSLQTYVIYELTEKGIVVDLLMTPGDISLVEFRYVLELYFVDEDKDTWALFTSIMDINNEIENYDHSKDSNNDFGQVITYGKNNKITRVEVIQVYVDQTFYGDTLTKDNLSSAFSGYIDSTSHQKEAKSLGEDHITWNGSIGAFSEEELSSVVSYAQNCCKNTYSPKFYGIEFKETDFVERLEEAISSL